MPCEAPSHSRLFQFTPLREGRRVCYGRIYYEIVFQFTPLREGRPAVLEAAEPLVVISIHVPPRGATSSAVIPHGRAAYFNSRPSARGDKKAETALYRLLNFNSRPSARGDAPASAPASAPDKFQFTPLREGRRARGGKIENAGKYFNSRPSARGDVKRIR